MQTSRRRVHKVLVVGNVISEDCHRTTVCLKLEMWPVVSATTNTYVIRSRIALTSILVPLLSKWQFFPFSCVAWTNLTIWVEGSSVELLRIFLLEIAWSTKDQDCVKEYSVSWGMELRLRVGFWLSLRLRTVGIYFYHLLLKLGSCPLCLKKLVVFFLRLHLICCLVFVY